MIFAIPRHIDMIRAGTKTQTRRLNRGIYKVGRDYAVQPKRGVAVSDIRIVMDEIWKEWCDYGGGHPYSILPKNAQAEGGYTSRDYEQEFKKAYPKWVGDRWAFKFHVIEVQID